MWGVVCSREKASFPVAWHGAIVGLGRPLADGFSDWGLTI
jgi:hypothetical protein